MTAGCLTIQPTNISVMWKTVSEACNLACNYCYYSRCGGRPGRIQRIDDDVLEKFIKEYMALPNGGASFTWQGGEPMLAGLDFFKKVVELQAKYAPRNTMITNAIQTNGTLITEKWARFFKEYNFLVGVSIDGPRKINDKRRVTAAKTGSFQRIMKGIENLRKYQVDFNILTVVHEDNVHRPRELMEFYEREGFRFVQFIPGMDFRAQEAYKEPQYLITPKEYGDFLCEVFDIWYNDGYPKMSIRFFDTMLNVYLNRQADLCIHRKYCANTIVLEQNGDAYPCDFYIQDDYKLGNVGTDRLEDLLNSEIYRKFRQLKPTIPEKCKGCEFLKLCHGGCPRNRIWSFQNDQVHVDPDYFCESYKQVYAYAHERMQVVATNVKRRWINEYVRSGGKLPERNARCLCGSGKKFKKCCALLLEMN